VVDGDGIHPDSTLADAYYPEFVSAMSAKGLDLRYAASVVESMEGTSPDAFTLSEEQWKAFTGFLAKEDFTFESLGERKLKQLEKAASELDYLSEEDIQILLANVEERKGKVLESQRTEITEYLEDYLVQKHFGLEGTLERGLTRDAQINAAASILLKAGTMEALLGVK
jgi:hypothetical protein